MKNIWIITLLLSIFVLSCKKDNNKTDKQMLATVYDKKLYVSDLDDFIPDGASSEDSIAIIKSKIDLWVRKQLMLNKAELNLSDEQKSIERIVEDYRGSLLIEKYKQEFLKQKLDTVINENEIQEFYTIHPADFRLNRELVKASFYKVPKSFDEINRFRQLYFSNNEQLDEYCIEKSITNQNFGNRWIPFSEISSLLPTQITKPEVILKSNKDLRSQDEFFYYFVKIKEYKLKGEVKPLELIKPQIKIVLINKRKTELIKHLENNVYQNAIEQGNLKIYEE